MSKKIKSLIAVIMLVVTVLTLLYIVVEINKKSETLYINKGVLDLTRVNMDLEYQLKGEWEIYNGVLLKPEDIKNNTVEKKYLDDSQKNINRKDSKRTYRVKIIDNTPKKLSIMLPDLSPAYRVWINKNLISKNGQIEDDKFIPEIKFEKLIIGKDMYVKNAEFYELDIIIEVQNFPFLKENIHKILIGNIEGIEETNTIIISLYVFAIGVYLILFLYSFSLYYSGKKEKYLLYFLIIAITSFFKSFISFCPYILNIVDIGYILLRKADFVTGMVNCCMILFLYYELYEKELNYKIIKIVSIINIITIISVLFVKFEITIRINGLYYLTIYIVLISLSFYINIKAVFHKGKAAFVLFVAISIYFISILFEILVSLRIIPYGEINKYMYFPQYGCLVFVIIFSVIISSKYGKRFSEADELSLKLKYTNENLQKVVMEKTKELKITNEKLIKSYNEAMNLATYDSMTKVYNRRAGLENLDMNLVIARKKRNSFCICYVDIDGLKKVNDCFGHEKGDELINEVVTILRSNIREHDFIIRMGGDEFIICFPNTKLYFAENIWKRILKKLEYLNKEEKVYLISLSHGIEEFDYNNDITLEELIKRSDEKMYTEKRQKSTT